MNSTVCMGYLGILFQVLNRIVSVLLGYIIVHNQRPFYFYLKKYLGLLLYHLLIQSTKVEETRSVHSVLVAEYFGKQLLEGLRR